MGRARIVLKRIPEPRKRKQLFVQRRKSLTKKIWELSKLCEVEACLIVYDDGNGDDGPMTWPRDPTVVHSIIQKYWHLKNVTNPNFFTIEDFFNGKKSEAVADICKAQKGITNIKFPTWHLSFQNMGEEQMRAFIAMLEAKIEVCDDRIRMLQNKQYQIDPSFIGYNISNIMQQNMAYDHQGASSSSSHQGQFNFMPNNIYQTQLIINAAPTMPTNNLEAMQLGDANNFFGLGHQKNVLFLPPSHVNSIQNNSQIQPNILATPKPLDENSGLVNSTNNQVNGPLEESTKDLVNEHGDLDEDIFDELCGDIIDHPSRGVSSLSLDSLRLDEFAVDYDNMLF
ncbi:hypothetical protein RJT34_16004 [Clitoria ternatea]|uniref:MADS-box domain-containing protein n=1 Tax=Clitoria ternatea TaxID=43366 RepID=A0AAN9J8F0_CLITE